MDNYPNYIKKVHNSRVYVDFFFFWGMMTDLSEGPSDGSKIGIAVSGVVTATENL